MGRGESAVVRGGRAGGWAGGACSAYSQLQNEGFRLQSWLMMPPETEAAVGGYAEDEPRLPLERPKQSPTS